LTDESLHEQADAERTAVFVTAGIAGASALAFVYDYFVASPGRPAAGARSADGAGAFVLRLGPGWVSAGVRF
jgi:hypothetical protein